MVEKAYAGRGYLMKEKIFYLVSFAVVSALYTSHLGAEEMAQNNSDEPALKEKASDLAQAEESFEWRFTPHVGWRKFSRLGAAIKDWKDWERVGAWRY